jgi:hypothetical protein
MLFLDLAWALYSELLQEAGPDAIRPPRRLMGARACFV